MVTKRVSRKTAPKAAVKVEEKNLRDYELVVVIRTDVTDENVEPILGKISQLITNQGGSVSKIERWGKRKLAYPIKHFMEGNYALINFRLSPASTKEVETNLEITEEIIRYLIVKK